MPTYKIAHILVGNVQFVIFPVSGSFTVRTPKEQEAMAKVFRDRAKAAGLEGHVVIIWDIEGGGIDFMCPLSQQALFKTIDPTFIDKNLNKTISW